MKSTRAHGDATRERILDVALPLFAAHGFAGTSVRAVASAAGVNVATLAYHFADKEGLYDTVVQRLHHDLAADLERLTASPPAAADPRALLRAWLGIGWRFAVAHREHLRLLVRHVLDHGAQPSVILERWSDPLLARADAILGTLRPDLGLPRRRLLVLALMHLIVRLVLENPAQLSAMSGIAENRLENELLDWLTEVAARELGLTPADGGL